MNMTRAQLQRVGVRVPPRCRDHSLDLRMAQTRSERFLRLLVDSEIEVPRCEYRFHPKRRWRFDYAWPGRKLALEVDGAVWVGGRHTRGRGWMADTEKINAAVGMGWRLLRCTPQQLCRIEMALTIREALAVAK